jgi:Delta7-sterol 5-desaturase
MFVHRQEIVLNDHSFAFYGIAFFGIILARYFVIAGGTYWYFYQNHHTAPPRSIQHDIQLSVLSTAVFALAAALIMGAYGAHHTRLYSDAQQYGWWYLGASYLAVLVLQDAYFYFTHRLFHHPLLFRWLHQGHHRSRQPTPWTSFAFDPLEALVQSAFLIGLVLVLPLHFITLIAVMTTMTIWSVLNHLGVDRLPTAFPHHWLGRWFIGPAHHSVHHRKYRFHYGLYFTFWDKWLGTQDPLYANQVSQHMSHPSIVQLPIGNQNDQIEESDLS